MTSWSTDILAAKSILHITYSNERFTSAFGGKVYEQMVALIQVEAWNFTISYVLKLVSLMKADVLFVGMQLFSRKRQKHARFMDGALKTWSIKNIEMLKLG